MPSKGFYELALPEHAAQHFGRVGVEVRVVCAGAESGLDFGVQADSRAARASQSRAYHALGVELGCRQSIGGGLRLIAPRPVPESANLTDDQLIQEAVGLGYGGDGNVNPVCYGMTKVGTDIASVATCHPFDDSPATWWAYTATIRGKPFAITGVLLCSWRATPRKLVWRQMEFIKRQVQDMGPKFNPDYLTVWMSPAGRNNGAGVGGVKQGFSISRADVRMLVGTNPDFEEYVILGAGTTPERPDGLDIIGLTMHQLFGTGLPPENLTGLYEDTVTTRTDDGTAFRWGSALRDGAASVSSVLAGTVQHRK